MLKVVPITFKQATSFIVDLHRHHRPPQGMKFCIGAADNSMLHGVAVAGRPVARLLDDGVTLEVTRLCTDGYPNCCSFLYGACRKIAWDMGYQRVITYILETEPGISLKAAGFRLVKLTRGDTWQRPNRSRTDKAPTSPKQLWESIPRL